jgi:hypothetical protein
MPDFKIRGFAGPRHPYNVPPGAFLMETNHFSEASAAIEITAWQSRIERGEVAYVELDDLRPMGVLTNHRVYADTEIAWSWKRGSLT